MKKLLRVIFGGVIMVSFSGVVGAEEEAKIEFIPMSHASFVIVSGRTDIYVDPTGDRRNYSDLMPPEIILITHTHGDHLDKRLVGELRTEDTTVIGTKAAVEELSYGDILNNSESKEVNGVKIEAVAAYNISPDRLKYHPKGVGNGYVVTVSGKRIYIAGDTEDTPEMRALKGIDYAFIPMNLPYTMTPEQAASAVLEFKPKVVLPYHYRQGKGFGDIQKFKKLVSKDKNIEIRLLNWYE